MNATDFGKFIQTLRKEQGVTQAQLGERLGVTDKAISRWERGIGFPDISLLEPLAGALGVTVVELMRSEKMEAESINKTEADAIMLQTIDFAKEQQRTLWRRRLLKWGLIPLVVLIEIFLTLIISRYVFEPFWLRVVCIAVVTYSAIFVVVGIRYVADCGYAKPAEERKPAMFYVTTALTCMGVMILGLSWLLNTDGMRHLYAPVSLLGFVLTFANPFYLYFLITDEIKDWNRFAGGRDIPKWVPWWKRRKKNKQQK